MLEQGQFESAYMVKYLGSIALPGLPGCLNVILSLLWCCRDLVISPAAPRSWLISAVPSDTHQPPTRAQVGFRWVHPHGLLRSTTHMHAHFSLPCFVTAHAQKVTVALEALRKRPRAYDSDLQMVVSTDGIKVAWMNDHLPMLCCADAKSLLTVRC